MASLSTRLVASICGLAVIGIGGTPAGAVAGANFTNPIIRSNRGSDAQVSFVGGRYYLVEDQGFDGSVWVYSAPTLTGLDNGSKTRIWTPPHCDPGSSPANSCELWQPELHYVAGAWFVYYSATGAPATDGFSRGHRVFALRGGTDPDDPLSAPFTDVGAVRGMPEQLAIDPTVLHTDAQCGSDPAGDYLVWGTLVDSVSEEIDLALLTSPTSIDDSRIVTISAPQPGWESATGGVPIDEGPTVAVHGGRINVLFSGGDIWTDTYAVGLVSNAGGCVRDAASWVRSPVNPIFQGANEVHAVGSVSVVPSPDGTQTWMVYQGEDDDNEKTMRLQPVSWNGDDTPALGTPPAPGTTLPLPSGELAPWGWGNAPGCAAGIKGCSLAGAWKFAHPRDAAATRTGASRAFFPGVFDSGYTLTLNLRATSDSAPTSILGAFAWFAGPGDYVRVDVAPAARQLVFEATVAGVARESRTAPLPASFKPSAVHHLSITRRIVAGDGVFDVVFDHHRVDALTGVDAGPAAVASGGVGLAADSQRAQFTNVRVSSSTSPWGWGDVPVDLGHFGDWKLRPYRVDSDPTAGSFGLCYTGHPPGSIFRTDIAPVDYTVTTWMRRNSLQCGDRYGVKMSERDDDANSVLVYVDVSDRSPSAVKNLVVRTHVDNVGADAATVTLQFDPAAFHQLRVQKKGATFTVFFDGAKVAVVAVPSLATLAGAIGLYSNLADVTFGKSALAPALRID